MKLGPFLRHGLLAASIVSAAVFTTAASTQASLITWGAPTNITSGLAGDLDVSTAGTLVGALNLGSTGVTSPTVNGVTFTGLAVGGTNATSGIFNLSSAVGFFSGNGVGSGAAPFSSLSAPYQALLSSIAGTSGGNSFTLTMSGLAVGSTYQFQWWLNNSSSGQGNTTATAGNSVTLVDNVSTLDGGTGQFAIGTFTADAVSQAITFGGPVGNAINAFQLRQLTPGGGGPAAVPEPGTALAGLVLVGLCGTLRRRQASAGVQG